MTRLESECKLVRGPTVVCSCRPKRVQQTARISRKSRSSERLHDDLSRHQTFRTSVARSCDAILKVSRMGASGGVTTSELKRGNGGGGTRDSKDEKLSYGGISSSLHTARSLCRLLALDGGHKKSGTGRGDGSAGPEDHHFLIVC